MAEALLEVTDLVTEITTASKPLRPVDGVTLSVNAGEILGLVGESGSGKSMVAFSIMGLLEHPVSIAGGTAKFRGADLCSMPASTLRGIRGNRIAMIFQDPAMTLNPMMPIGMQIVETILAHRTMSKKDAWVLARDTLGRVGIASPEERMRSYPHQFSGGMRQRTAIAIALVNDPDLIIADEPTTALDVTVQSQILSEIQDICAERGTAIVWISHDLSVVAGLADRVAVMYAGRIVETGPVQTVLNHPKHPYTAGLLRSIPDLDHPGDRLSPIPGIVPPLSHLPTGCTFRTRCDRADDACLKRPEALVLPGHGVVACHHSLVEKLEASPC